MRIVTIAACLGVGAVISVFGQSSRSTQPLTTTLGVPGASNSTPSLAATGRTVAAIWTATKDGAADLYLAVSHDGGCTFSAPRRVNDRTATRARRTNSLRASSFPDRRNARAFTVVWSKRDPGPQQTRRDIIRMARSTDGGRTFTPAQFAHDPSFAAHVGGSR